MIVEQRIKERIDEYDGRIQKLMHDAIKYKTNRLGEEIANDVNSMETKLKSMQSDQHKFDNIFKDSMLTLEKKFDKAMEHKPIVRTVKQKVDYAAIQKMIDGPMRAMEQEVKYMHQQTELVRSRLSKQSVDQNKLFNQSSEIYRKLRDTDRLVGKVMHT